MTAIDKVLEIATGELGYMGHGSRSDLDNPEGSGNAKYTKYARDLDAIGYFNGKKQGFDWCAVFVAWCFFRAFGKDESQRMLTFPPRSCAAGVKWVYSYGKRAGRIVKTPQRGDIMILRTSDGSGWRHVAIVSGVQGTKVRTVEGNNGNRVREWSYEKTNPTIAGYLRPLWSLAIPEQIEPEIYTVVRGDSLWKIAKRYYGAGSKYKIIMRANGLKSSLIHAGQTLIIPDID